MSEDSNSYGEVSQPLDKKDWGIALIIFALVLGVLLATMDVGFTRDESFYFHAARDYIRWFEGLYEGVSAGTWRESFQKAAVDRHWSYNNEHPVLMKTLFALSEALFHRKLAWMESSTAMRLPTAALSALLCSGVYLFARQLFGRVAGGVAAAAMILQPRFFFDAHMACFDAPIGAMWFLTVYAYWKSWRSKRWAVATGIFWGLALATKLNAFFIPIVFVLHWVWATWRQWGVVRDVRSGRWMVAWPQMPWAFVAMALLGPLIFYLHWPYIWFDTFARVKWYMMFHLEHVHYFAQYFGQNLIRPPFPVDYPVGMTLVTVPATLLVASALGVGAYWSERGGKARLVEFYDGLKQKKLPPALVGHRATGVLLALNFLVPIAIIAQPSTPVFGGTKHWIPSMPFLAMLAGFGAVVAARRAVTWWETTHARSRVVTVSASVLMCGAVVLPAFGELGRSHPQGIAYYNELIGSYQGAADRGMMRQFWGYASRQALPWVNANAPKNSRVDPQNTTSWAWEELVREGLVREDITFADRWNSDYVLFEQQKAFHYIRHDLWRQYGVRAPSHVHEIEGVPLISVYERPAIRKKRLGLEDPPSPPAPKVRPSRPVLPRLKKTLLKEIQPVAAPKKSEGGA